MEADEHSGIVVAEKVCFLRDDITREREHPFAWYRLAGGDRFLKANLESTESFFSPCRRARKLDFIISSSLSMNIFPRTRAFESRTRAQSSIHHYFSYVRSCQLQSATVRPPSSPCRRLWNSSVAFCSTSPESWSRWCPSTAPS